MTYEEYDETVMLKFMDFIDIGKEQIDVICDKTTHQGQRQFWFDQRAGQITASNFIKFVIFEKQLTRPILLSCL